MSDVTLAQQALSLLDLTSLNDNDNEESTVALAQSAHTPFGPPAALCLYPAFLTTARSALDWLGLPSLKLATVVNFPAGGTDQHQLEAECAAAVQLGADEIDMVFPWRALQDGDQAIGARMVAACRGAMPAAMTLKVIIESGELASETLITAATEIAIAEGADFVKTSTGKTRVSATLPAAEIILGIIKARGGNVGFKASGGVRSLADARAYLELAARIMGPDWITPDHFRFGASSLLGALLATLGQRPADTTAAAGSY